MVLRRLCHVALLLIFAVRSSAIDCSRENSCFGEPSQCNPDETCRTMFQFEEDGSLNLYLRNFTDPLGYAAFAIGSHPDETIEYLFCIPHQENRYRGFAELGGAALVIEQNLTGFVEQFDNSSFRCFFNVSEISNRFQQEQVFFVSSGTFDEALVILDGVELHNLEFGDDDEDVDYRDSEDAQPVVHYLGTPVEQRSADTVSSDPANYTAELLEAVEMRKAPARLSRARRHWIGDDEEADDEMEREYDDVEEQNVNPEDDYESMNSIRKRRDVGSSEEAGNEIIHDMSFEIENFSKCPTNVFVLLAVVLILIEFL